MDQRALSKLLSFVLRHEPAALGLELGPGGWVEVDALLAALARHGKPTTQTELERLVVESDKQRFALSPDGRRIRANQGHSVDVDLALAPQAPPARLFHGTVPRFLSSIRATGLVKGERHHVHLSEERDVAIAVASRRGKPHVLEIAAADMARDGYVFFLSDNGVWLTEHVPASYISFTETPG